MRKGLAKAGGGLDDDGRTAGDISPSGSPIDRVLKPRRLRYAEKIIDDPRRFDAVEVHEVYEISDPDWTSYEEASCYRSSPFAFGVYAHLREGGIDCCGDFSRRSDALAYGEELANNHRWPIFDFTSGGATDRREALRRDALFSLAVTLRDGCLQALDPLDGSFEDDRPAISAIRSVYEVGIAEVKRQLEVNKDQYRSKARTVNGQ